MASVQDVRAGGGGPNGTSLVSLLTLPKFTHEHSRDESCVGGWILGPGWVLGAGCWVLLWEPPSSKKEPCFLYSQGK